jgi:hypothetical protein
MFSGHWMVSKLRSVDGDNEGGQGKARYLTRFRLAEDKTLGEYK